MWSFSFLHSSGALEKIGNCLRRIGSTISKFIKRMKIAVIYNSAAVKSIFTVNIGKEYKAQSSLGQWFCFLIYFLFLFFMHKIREMPNYHQAIDFMILYLNLCYSRVKNCAEILSNSYWYFPSPTHCPVPVPYFYEVFFLRPHSLFIQIMYQMHLSDFSSSHYQLLQYFYGHRDRFPLIFKHP